MPTSQPRYTFTDSGRVRELLDAAQRRWPETEDRKALLLRLAERGHEHLAAEDEGLAADERHGRMQVALSRIPALVDAELLLSDRAWN